MRTTQKGFTLVEIAIVLVIIGLLLGGILKGQEMIVQARIKNVAADFSGVSAAYYGYRDRYRATPGDDPGGDRWGSGLTSATAGDGIVTGKYNAAAASPEPESRLWWDHLRRAGFISGAGAGQPSNAAGGMIGVQTGDGTSAPPAAALGGLYALIMCSANLPDKIAIAVDAQMDDGVGTTGSVRAAAQAGNADVAATTPTATYAETGTNVYTICRTF
jgi:prepilin-type N-terminal cleavage/methylation domain-containing protein